jgi:hypothetical protein
VAEKPWEINGKDVKASADGIVFDTKKSDISKLYNNSPWKWLGNNLLSHAGR